MPGDILLVMPLERTVRWVVEERNLAAGESRSKVRRWRETTTGTEAGLRSLVAQINADPDPWEARLVRVTETREVVVPVVHVPDQFGNPCQCGDGDCPSSGEGDRG